MDIITEGLKFPEGPVAMADGSVILVEIKRGAVTRCWGDGRKEIIASPGGGPNGAAIGPDGALYICNNGGFTWRTKDGITSSGRVSEDYECGRIERLDLATGKLDRLYDRCGEHMLNGPNDIVFDRAGGFWFTDLGKARGRVRDMGGLYYATPDGRSIREAAFGLISPNGVGLSPDEKTLYVADTLTARLLAFDLSGPGEIIRRSAGFPSRVVATLPGERYLDSLAVAASGNVCVATLITPGVTTITPAGEFHQVDTPDPYTTNICFGEADMQTAWITLSGTGRLARMRWPEPGLRLNFNG
ncbi:SMP-30/gluconolactonase/LRE family protein [bacterium]|nr:SMP-30/gluconolactonase/LRE family protein [bacterium]